MGKRKKSAGESPCELLASVLTSTHLQACYDALLFHRQAIIALGAPGNALQKCDSAIAQLHVFDKASMVATGRIVLKIHQAAGDDSQTKARQRPDPVWIDSLVPKWHRKEHDEFERWWAAEFTNPRRVSAQSSSQ